MNLFSNISFVFCCFYFSDELFLCDGGLNGIKLAGLLTCEVVPVCLVNIYCIWCCWWSLHDAVLFPVCNLVVVFLSHFLKF